MMAVLSVQLTAVNNITHHPPFVRLFQTKNGMAANPRVSGPIPAPHALSSLPMKSPQETAGVMAQAASLQPNPPLTRGLMSI